MYVMEVSLSGWVHTELCLMQECVVYVNVLASLDQQDSSYTVCKILVKSDVKPYLDRHYRPANWIVLRCWNRLISITLVPVCELILSC